MMQRRNVMLVLASAATVAVSIWAAYLPEDQLTPQSSAPRREPVRVASQAARATPVLAAEADTAPAAAMNTAAAIATRPAPATVAQDLFSAHSWNPPPPPAPEAPPPPPQLPFSYTGRMEIAGKESFLLLEGLRTHIIAVGAEANGFRLESANPTSLTFVHVASGQRVPLALKP